MCLSPWLVSRIECSTALCKYFCVMTRQTRVGSSPKSPRLVRVLHLTVRCFVLSVDVPSESERTTPGLIQQLHPSQPNLSCSYQQENAICNVHCCTGVQLLYFIRKCFRLIVHVHHHLAMFVVSKVVFFVITQR